MTRVDNLRRPRAAIVAAAAVAAVMVVAGLAAQVHHVPPGTPPVVSDAVHHDSSAPLAMVPDSRTPGRTEGMICQPIDEAAGEDPGAERLTSPAGMCPAGFAPTVENEDNSVEARREGLFPKPRTSRIAVDTVVQTSNSKAPSWQMPATATSWDGLGQGFVGPAGTMSVQSAPPDTSLDVGTTQVVEVVNSELAVFNKTGTVLLGPVATNTLWAGFGGLCETTNDGDATVQWDRLANRWVISQFAVTGADGSATPFLQCLAVSQTADATGAYNRYSFSYSFFNDYPKLAVWPDAYYTTFNDFNAAGTAYLGATTCAYNRTAMLAGTAATQQCFTTSTLYGGVLVAGVEGSAAPAAGTAAYAIAEDTSTAMVLWRFHVDWATPANSTWTLQTAPAVASWLAPCDNSGGTCIPQAGTTQLLDTLGDRAMYRFVYRNVGGSENFALSWSVNSGNNTSSIRWARFTPSGTTLTVADQGTYAPDTASRWMPSIAMDMLGDLALVYSTSSSTTTPSVRYAGRLAGDTPGLLVQGEATIVTGGGSQTSNLSRWGDYAGIGVDPADDCTFWMASEYIPADGSFNWKTRIASFAYPSCTSVSLAPVATLMPPSTPTNAASLTYTVGFDKPVTGLASGDFSVTGTATGCVVGDPSGSGASYTVALTGCSEGTVTLTLLANTVADASLNTGPAFGTGTTPVTVDRTAPTVSAFTSAVSSPSRSTSIAYSLAFSESVTGVAKGDFTNAGTATGCAFAPTGSGASYTVTVTTCSTSGTLQPQLEGNSIADLASNTGPASGSAATAALTLDRVAPAVSSITRSLALTNAATATFTVTFSESVAGVAAGNFSLATTGLVGSSITGVTGAGASWTVTVATGSGSGTIRVDLSSVAPAIGDAAGNSLTAPFSTGSVLNVDRVAPIVSAFASAVSSPTISTSVAYSLAFSESVSGIAVGDFTNAGTATGCAFAPSAASASGGTPITLTVTGCAATGTLQPQLAAGGVTDTAGNTGPAGAASASAALTLDRVAPAATAITPSLALTNAATATFTVTFGESVAGVAAGNFTLATTGTITGASVSNVAGSGATRTITISTGSGDGTIRVDLSSAFPTITDVAGNALTATFSTGAALTVDKTAPTNFTSPIAVSLRAGTALSSPSTTSAVPVLITWAATDGPGGSGVASYRLETSLDNLAWTQMAPQSLATSLATTMRTSGVVYYRVTACDATSNCITSATGALTPRITQQSSSLVRYGGAWYLYKSASASGTTLKWSRTRNAYVTYTFTGRRIGFVTIKGPTRGSVRVYIDGKYKLTVSLYKTGTNLGRVLAWQSGVLTAGKHTITLQLVGTAGHPRVDIDAFVVMK